MDNYGQWFIMDFLVRSNRKTGITRGDTEVVRINWDPGSAETRNTDYKNIQGHKSVIPSMWFKNNLRYLVKLTYMEELWGRNLIMA